MKITIINGSPRGKKSNSKMLTDQFLAGLAKANPATEHETFYLVNLHQIEDANEACQQGDLILLVFPLYTDAMPAVVKQFFERMPSLPGKKIVYLI
jgi:multimeric flavodoxin WrbA